MGSDPLVEIGLYPEKVEDGGYRQVHHERGGCDNRCVIRVGGTHLTAVGDQQRRKKDGI